MMPLSCGYKTTCAVLYTSFVEIRLRAMTAEDIPEGMHLSTTANWNQLTEDWRFFQVSPGSGAFVAEKDSRVVGSVAYVRYDRLAWIAMMLVAPEERRAGIGAKLMSQALAGVREAPCVGLDATPLGEPLYRRCGFVADHTLVRTKSTIAAHRFAAFTGGARPMNPGDLPAVFARDRDAFGAD